jgi:hypothetical protein
MSDIMPKRAGRRVVAALGAMAALGGLAGPALAQGTVDPEADRILKAMSAYLGGLQAFTAAYDVDQEVVTRQGQKLQSGASGTIAIARPGRMHVTRKDSGADGELFLDRGTVTLADHSRGVYTELAGAATIDQAIDEVRAATDLDAAGADLLFADPYPGLMTDVTEGAYLGRSYVGGTECDDLAFRAASVDWQICIATGDRPLPLKYVITSTWVTGAPQYAIRFRDWQTDAAPDEAQFRFVPAGSMRKIEALPGSEASEAVIEETPQ